VISSTGKVVPMNTKPVVPAESGGRAHSLVVPLYISHIKSEICCFRLRICTHFSWYSRKNANL